MKLSCNYGTYDLKDDGTIDDSASEVFTHGHCHSFAYALHRLTGWQLVGLYHPCQPLGDCTPWHCCVETPSGDVLDIDGGNALQRFEEYGCTIKRSLTEADVLNFERIDYLPINIEAAMPFAINALSRYNLIPIIGGSTHAPENAGKYELRA